jgi:hypothetical protein
MSSRTFCRNGSEIDNPSLYPQVFMAAITSNMASEISREMAGPVGSIAAGTAAIAATFGRGTTSLSGSGTASPDSVRLEDETPDCLGGAGDDKSCDGDVGVESWEEEEAWPQIVPAEADNNSVRLRAPNKIRKLKPTARLHCMATF